MRNPLRNIDPRAALTEIVIWSAFAASAGHIYKVATAMGNPWPVAAVHALGLDGLVYVGIIAFQSGAKIRGALAVIYGGGVSLAFNAASYTEGHRLPVWVMAMSMPVSLVLGVLVGHGTTTRKTPPAPEVPKPATRHAPHPVPVARETAEPVAATPVRRAPKPAPRPAEQIKSSAGSRKAELYDVAVRRVIDGGESARAVAISLGEKPRNVQNWAAEETQRRLDGELKLLSSSLSSSSTPPAGPGNRAVPPLIDTTTTTTTTTGGPQ